MTRYDRTERALIALLAAGFVLRLADLIGWWTA